MSSRGSKTRNGHVTTTEYKEKEGSKVEGAKVLVGQGHAHGLPDFAHTPDSIYIKENADGSFREMRIYGDDGYPVLEIGFHGEINLTGNRTTPVLHYHLFDRELIRSPAIKLTEDMELMQKYKKILEEYGL